MICSICLVVSGVCGPLNILCIKLLSFKMTVFSFPCTIGMQSEHSLGLWNFIPVVDLFCKPQLFLFLLTSDKDLAVIQQISSLITWVRWSCTLQSSVITISRENDFLLFVVLRWLIVTWQLCHKSEIRHIWRQHWGPWENCWNVNNCWIYYNIQPRKVWFEYELLKVD